MQYQVPFLCVIGMTQPGTEPQSPWPLVNTETTREDSLLTVAHYQIMSVK